MTTAQSGTTMSAVTGDRLTTRIGGYGWTTGTPTATSSCRIRHSPSRASGHPAVRAAGSPDSHVDPSRPFMCAGRTPPDGSIDAPCGDAGWRNVVTRTPVGSQCRIEVRERSSRCGLYSCTARAHSVFYDGRDRPCPLMAADGTVPSGRAERYLQTPPRGSLRSADARVSDNLRMGFDQRNLRASRHRGHSFRRRRSVREPTGLHHWFPQARHTHHARYTLPGRTSSGLRSFLVGCHFRGEVRK